MQELMWIESHVQVPGKRIIQSYESKSSYSDCRDCLFPQAMYLLA